MFYCALTTCRCDAFQHIFCKSKENGVLQLQGLIQKEKVHIDCKKGAEIKILANNIVT